MKSRTKTSEAVSPFKDKTIKVVNSAKSSWTTNFVFECCGVRIKIRINKKVSLDKLQTVLPPFSREIKNGEVDRVFSLKLSDSESVLSDDEDEKLRAPGNDWITEALRAELKSCVSRNSPENAFIHAGVVAWQNKLILIPGEGFAGKTTLTAELVKAGAVYYSDDMAVADRNGLIYPYPKPLSIRQRESVDGAQINYDVAHFRGVQAIDPLPVSLVIVTEYHRRARWQPQILSPGQGVLELLKHTTNSLKFPRLVMPILRKIAVQAKIIKTKRGEADKTARAILLNC